MKGLLVSLTLLYGLIPIKAQTPPCAIIQYPKISESAKVELEQKLRVAQDDFKKDTTDADALIWYGRRLGYLGRYTEAIEVFSMGLKLHPLDARMYRHRGHRYLTVRCVDLAIRDFEKASQLIKGTKDEVEPDGLPNAQNIPTSTLQSNIWYHLGLAYYLKGDYVRAIKAYRNGSKVSTNPDMYVATANWYYITLRKLHKDKKASKLLSTIHPSMKVIENKDYLELLMLYKTPKTEIEIAQILNNTSSLSNATRSFGVGNYFLLNGDIAKAKQIFEKVIQGDQWASFGFMAVESTLKSLMERSN